MLLKVFAAHERKDDQNISYVTCSDLEFQQPASTTVLQNNNLV